MKSSHAIRLLTLTALAPLLATSALAQDSYYYGGLSVGKSRTNLDEQGIATNLLPAGVTATGISSQPKDTGYKVFGGYQFNRNLALEINYVHLGQYGFAATTAPAGTLNGKIQIQGGTFDLVGLAPLSDNFSLLGRIGAQYVRTLDNFSGTGAAVPNNASPSWRHGNFKVGAGFQYAFSPSVLMRVEGERYRVNDAVGHDINANLYTVGLVFPFGRSAAPAPRVSMAPAYVAPEPVVVLAPVPPATPIVAFAPPAPRPLPVPLQRVSYSAESMFAFDRSELRPEGKTALDTFARELAGTQFDSITVEGHTDRLGTDVYNQKLSLERAEAVKSYLVAGGIDAAKVNALGKGETTPVTKAEECKGQAQNAQLIACLAPDRRVEIEVSGTR